MASAPAPTTVDLLILAEDAPGEAIRRARREIIAAMADDDRSSEVHARRALATASRNLGRTEVALRELDIALERAGADARLAGLVRVSRAACVMSLGRPADALADVDWAVDQLTGADRGVALFQRGSIVARSAGYWTAAPDFDAAIPLLRRGHMHLYEAHALNNRGAFRAYAGQYGPARVDIERARKLYLRIGDLNGASSALHNLGFVALERWDVITALELLEQARIELNVADRLAPDPDMTVLDALELDYCRALLAAGRATEARERAIEVTRSLVAHENEFEAPEATLVAALACLQGGDDGQARQLAATAAATFAALGRLAWARSAALVELVGAPSSAHAAAEARQLAADLEGDGLPVPATMARLLAADLASRHGDVAAARRDLASARSGRVGPEQRISICELEARLADAEGDGARTMRWSRCGLRELARYQSSFASTELRWSVGIHARRLVENGRDRALRSGRPAQIFRWIELTRANALRRAPLQPPADPKLEALLGDLRATGHALMDESANPADALELTARRDALQRAIVRRERMLRNPATPMDMSTVALRTVQTLVADGALLQLDVVDGVLLAIRIDRRRAALVPLGPVAAIAATFRALSGDLSRLAAPGKPSAATTARVARRREQLDAAFAPCVRHTDADRMLVIVPPPSLHDAPWAAVPRLGDTTLTVAGSATLWSAARLAPQPEIGRVVLVAGRDLHDAAREVRAIAACHTAPTVLPPHRATAKRVRAAVDGAWLAHFATHHQHRRDNPLFGSLSLADGPWYLHDLLRVVRMPSIVVLSACEAGRGDANPVGDVLGAATVMMERGTASVVATSSLVSDDTSTIGAMTGLHRMLAAGISPAAALLELRSTAGDSTESALIGAYSCYGLG